MPTTSPGHAPGATVSDLGLPGRAVNALIRAGITRTSDLALLTRRDLAAISGLGPGTIAAIRTVVPEPPARLAPPGPPAGTAEEHPPFPASEPGSGWDEQESPATPPIPSFESLRSPHHRTTVDLTAPAAPSPAEPQPPVRRGTAPRPAEWADLGRLGLRAARCVACLPARLALCAAAAPGRRLRRLLGA